MSDVVAVEAKASLRIRTRYGRKRFGEFTGTFAVNERDIAMYVERLPYRVKILEREATEAEVKASVAAGLLPDPAAQARRAASKTSASQPQTPPKDPPADGETGSSTSSESETQPPEKPFSQINKDPLIEIANALGLDSNGVKNEILERVAAYAELSNISLEGTESEVTARLTGAKKD